MTRTLLLVALLAVAAPEEEAPSPEETAPKPPEDVLRVLSTGAEPRHRLRHRIPAGATETVDLEIGVSARHERPGREAETIEGSLRARLELRSGLPGESGRTALSVRLVSFSFPEADPSIQHMTESGLETLKAGSVDVVVDPRGRWHSAHLVGEGGRRTEALVPARALRWLLLPLLPPFPEEPVGVGARWETTVRPPVPGVDLTQRVELELEAIEEKAVRLRLRVTHEAPTGRIRHPKIPPGVLIGLTSFESSGGGSLVLPRGRLVPEAGLRIETRGAATVLSPAGVRTDKAELTVSVRIRPAD